MQDTRNTAKYRTPLECLTCHLVCKVISNSILIRIVCYIACSRNGGALDSWWQRLPEHLSTLHSVDNQLELSTTTLEEEFKMTRIASKLAIRWSLTVCCMFCASFFTYQIMKTLIHNLSGYKSQATRKQFSLLYRYLNKHTDVFEGTDLFI